MATIKELVQEINDLLAEGYIMKDSLFFKAYPDWEKKRKKKDKDFEKPPEHTFELFYQDWYSKAIRVMKFLLPERLDEFNDCYSFKTKGPKKVQTMEAEYRIYDFLSGVHFNPKVFPDEKLHFKSAVRIFDLQLKIFVSATSLFKSKVKDIRNVLRADFFDSEIDGARELLKNGFLRPAGVICGVVLEKHFAQVVQGRSIKISKKNPTINDFNEALKTAEVIDIPMWRRIQLLGDLRNNACHGKSKEPSKEDIEELISGTAKVIKTVF